MSILLSKQLEQNQCFNFKMGLSIDNQKWHDTEQSASTTYHFALETHKKNFAEKYQEGSRKIVIGDTKIDVRVALDVTFSQAQND